MPAQIDHLVVTGATLPEAVALPQDRLGQAPGPVGHHQAMATHNQLWSLGPDLYLEAIAPDPDAVPPPRARWFGLDQPGPVRLSHWVLQVDDLDAALKGAPEGIGPVQKMTRGAYRWRITVPQDGRLPFDGMFPALIAWDSAPPAPALKDFGARLMRLKIRHPRAGQLGWLLSLQTDDDRVVVQEGPVGLTALIHGQDGEVIEL